LVIVLMQISQKKIKRGIILSVTVSIMAIIVVMLLSDSELSLRTFSRIDSNYFLLAAVITISIWVLRTLKIQTLVRAMNGDIGFVDVFRINMASLFIAHVTPSSVGGFPFQIYLLHRKDLPLGKSTAISMLDGILNIFLFIILIPLFVFFWGAQINLGADIRRFIYLGVFLMVLLIVIVLFLIFHVEKARKFLNWLISRRFLRRFFKEKSLKKAAVFIERELEYFHEGFRILSRSRRNMLLVIIFNLLYWAFYFSLAPILLIGLGVNPPVFSVIIAQLLFNIIQPLIPTPGGSGGAELGFAYLFQFMIPGQLLGVFVVLWRFFMFYASLAVGGLFFVSTVKGTNFVKEL